MFPEGCSGGTNSEALLLSALNNNGGFGGGNWMWILFLFFLWPFMRGGFGNGFGPQAGLDGFGALSNQISNANGRDLLMQAINGNGAAIERLAGMLNCDVNSIKSAITGVMNQITEVGNKVGMGTMEVINAVQRGNTDLGQQIAQCCCENRLAISQQTNTLQSAIGALATGVERGFSSVAFETAQQTCDLKGTIKDGVADILGKVDAMEKAALMDKLDALRERNSTLTTQLNLEHQNAVTAATVNSAVTPILGMLTSVQKEVDAIKCAQPSTTTIPYSPVVGVPTCVAAQYGIYGYPYQQGFWG